jgi:ABC-type uncharacterized transport system permease subunit
MWSEILTQTFIIGVLTAGVRLATPILLAVLGEIFAEQAGVLKISWSGVYCHSCGHFWTLASGWRCECHLVVWHR